MEPATGTGVTATSAPAGADLTAAPDHRPGLTLLATGLGLFMVFLDATIVNVALPSIQKDFDVGESGLQWVVAAYSLTMGMFMMTSASLSDSRGRRRAYIVGIAVFCLASLACGLAPSVAVLNVTRALQGVGAAVVNVASLALVGAAYPDPKEKAKAVGMWTGIAAVGIAIGPTVGGVLTEAVGWRWVFLVNPVVGVIAVALTLAFVAESADPQRHSFDLPGQLMFIVGVGAITFALVQAPVYGFSSPVIVGTLVTSVVVLVAFVFWELRSPDPMMDVRVFADIPYTAAIVTVLTVLYCAYGTLLVITQYFQNVRGYSPERAGVLLLAFSVPSMVMAPIAGRLVARFGGRRPTLTGLGLVAMATATLAFSAGRPVWVTVVGLLLIGFGIGLSISPATAVAMASISPDRSGMASGILSAQRAIGSTAGFAVMGSLLALVVAAQLPEDLEQVIPSASERDAVVADVVDAANPHAVPATIGPKADDLRPEAVAAAEEAFDAGIRLAEASGLVLVFGALVFGWVVFPRTGTEEETEELDESLQLEDSPPDPAVRRVVDAARERGLDIRPYRFPEGTRTAVDAAEAVGVDVAQIVKSLVFAVDDRPVVALVSGANQLDPPRLAAAAGGQRADRVDADAVRAATGFSIGGVPPFGHVTDMAVFLDVDLLAHDVVWAAAGTGADVFEVAPEALVAASRAVTAVLRREG